MNLLLDTHVFLWYISNDGRLSEAAKRQISDRQNGAYLSVVSLWEAIIKYGSGKLPLPQPPHIYIPEQRRRHQILPLPVDEASVARVAQLPPHHRDPFDRLLIAQALEKSFVFVSVDDEVQRYPVTLLPME